MGNSNGTDTASAPPDSMSGSGPVAALFSEHPDPMAILDPRGHVVEINRALRTLLGACSDDTTGRQFCDVLGLASTEPSRAVLVEAIAGAASGANANCGSSDASAAPGTAGPIVIPIGPSADIGRRRISWRIQRAQGGEAIFALGRELPGRAHKHWLLERMAQVAEHTANLVIITDVDRRIEWVNKAFTLRTGYTLEEARGYLPTELLHDGIADPQQLEDLKQRLEAGEAVRCELRSRTKDGSIFWCDLDVQPLIDETGTVVAFLSVRTETTERRQREQQALAERNRLRATLDALPDLLIEVDADGRYAHFHSGRPNALPTPPERCLGRTLEEVLPPEVAAQRRDIMRELDQGAQPRSHLYRLEVQRREVWREISAARRDADRPGEAPGYLFLIRDATDRIEAEKGLYERESLLRGLFSLSPLGIALSDLETGAFLEVNEALLEATGYTRAEFLSKRDKDLLPADGADAHREAMAILRKTGRLDSIETAHRRKDGTLYPVRRAGLVLKGASGRRLVWNIIEDLSERRGMEESLSRSARAARDARLRLMSAVDSLPDAFVYFDADDRLLMCNERYIQLYPETAALIRPGVRFAEIVSANLDRGVYRIEPGTEQAWLEASIAAHQADGQPLEVPLSNGRWLRMIDVPTADGGRIGVRQDITELKHAEQRLADIIHGAQAGTWEWHLDTGQNHVNARWAEMLGYQLEELGAPTIDVWNRLTHPDDRTHIETRLERVLSGRELQFEYEMRMQHKLGHWVWVLSRGRVVVRSSEGRPEVMAGVHLDITAQKEAEQRLEQIIAGAQVGTWQLDLRTGTNHVNALWAEMIGYRLDEITPHSGQDLIEMIHPDDRDRFDKVGLMHSGDENGHVAGEFRMRHRSGRWVWVMSRGRVTSRDADGRPLVVSGVHIDITERKQLEAALVAETAYVGRLIETSVSGVLARDETGRVVFANADAERLMGLIPPDDNSGVYRRRAYRAFALDGRPLSSSQLPYQRVLQTGAPVRDARLALEVDGQPRRYLSVNAAPIQAEGMHARVVQSVTDITAQVEAEIALRHAVARAEAANDAKSGFLANISHEIRTPLNGVLGMAELLEEELTQDRQREMLDAIRESGQLLLHTLNDVLDMSRIEAGKLTLEQIAFSPAELLDKIEAVYGMIARDKGLRLETSAGTGAKQTRLGDPYRLMQVLNNLVGNALKFTEKGAIRIEIGAAGKELQIKVSDTGIGMSQDQCARIFAAFEQADGTVSRRFGGSGLGMAIVQRLIEMMGGDITLDSAPEQGTRFAISLPLPVVTPQHDPDRPAPAGAAPLQAEGLAGVRVLAADDNATNQRILSAMLQRLGAEVTMVGDGRAALEAWAPGRFDVLLLDISMPEMDGAAALEAIKARAASAGVTAPPAIAITAHALAHQIAQYRAAGFAAHVPKPFRRDALVEAIAALRQGSAD